MLNWAFIYSFNHIFITTQILIVLGILVDNKLKINSNVPNDYQCILFFLIVNEIIYMK